MFKCGNLSRQMGENSSVKALILGGQDTGTYFHHDPPCLLEDFFSNIFTSHPFTLYR
jgi:hypothetical protein